MSPKVAPIPAGFHALTPHLIVNDSKKAAEFYKKAFGAEVLGIHTMPDGTVMHAAVKIGDSILMFNDEFPSHGALSPTSTGGKTSVTVHLYVEDADKVYASAVAAGATPTMPLMDQFWGDRYGQLKDPFGHNWAIATHIKDQTPEEMKVAQDEAMANMPATK